MPKARGRFNRLASFAPIASTLIAVAVMACLPLGLYSRNPPYHAYGGLVLPNWIFFLVCATLTVLLALPGLVFAASLWRRSLALLSLLIAWSVFAQLGETIAAGSHKDVCFEHLATIGIALTMYAEDNNGVLPSWKQLAAYLPYGTSLEEEPTPLPWYAFWVRDHKHRHRWNQMLVGKKVDELKGPLIIAYDTDVWRGPPTGRRCLSVENREKLDCRLRWIPEEEWPSWAEASGIQ